MFELPSGQRCQSEFITLWELFDHRDELERCMQMFAEKAKEIRGVNPFSTIVTCAPTTRHILENVHADIETKDEKVQAALPRSLSISRR